VLGGCRWGGRGKKGEKGEALAAGSDRDKGGQSVGKMGSENLFFDKRTGKIMIVGCPWAFPRLGGAEGLGGGKIRHKAKERKRRWGEGTTGVSRNLTKQGYRGGQGGVVSSQQTKKRKAGRGAQVCSLGSQHKIPRVEVGCNKRGNKGEGKGREGRPPSAPRPVDK